MAGVWTHYAVNRDAAGTLRIYVNGVLDGTGGDPFLLPFHVGLLGSAAAGVSHAQFDDIRVWSTARSGGEIAGSMSVDVESSEPGLERLYRFDDSSTEVRDHAGHSAPTPLIPGITTVTSTAPVSPPPLGTPVPPGPGAEVISYVYDQGELDTLSPSDIAMEFAGGVLTKRWVYSGMTDEPLGFEVYAGTTLPGTGSVYEMFADRQGSITDVVETATGTIAAKYSYDAFGLQTVLSGILTQPYGYTGREFDPESGLYHLRWRTYDPVTGLFLQMDPLGFGGGLENLYAYTDGNPVMASDPMGLSLGWSENRVLVNGQQQTLGGATRAAAGAAIVKIGQVAQTLGDWRLIFGNIEIGQIADGPGSSCHGNSHKDNRGQHLYVIYNMTTGAARKFGVGNAQELSYVGKIPQSSRAMKQLASNEAHTVLIIIPPGTLSRGAAYIVETMMVTFITQTLGMKVPQGLPLADKNFCPINGKY